MRWTQQDFGTTLIAFITIVCTTAHGDPADYTSTRQLHKDLKTVFLSHRNSSPSDEHIDRLNTLCSRDYLNLALRFRRDPASQRNIITELVFQGFNAGVLPQFILEKIYYYVIDPGSTNRGPAEIRRCDATCHVCEEESTYRDKRNKRCARALSEVLGKDIAPHTAPRIAVCCSGGGFRAMLSTAGLLRGLHNTGLLDAVTYTSSISGSSWTIASWLAEGKPFHSFYADLIQRASHTLLNKPIDEHLSDIWHALPDIAQSILAKVIFKQKPSVIDIYGFLLAQYLLSEEDRHNYHEIDITHQCPAIEDGTHPFPLHSAIVPRDARHYSWVEFSPYEVIYDDFNVAMPAWAFGRGFKQGVSINNAPPVPLSYLMALWGSIMAMSFEELYEKILSSLQPQEIFQNLRHLFTETSLHDTRLFAAEVNNPTFLLSDMLCSQEERLPVVDAAIETNIALRPLLARDRDIDIIIICDASNDTNHPGEACAATIEDLRAEGYALPHIDVSTCNQPWTIWDDGPEKPGPAIIYIGLTGADSYDASFDPHKETREGFLSTFNFSYTTQQARTIAGLFEHKVTQARDDIRDIIARYQTWHTRQT